MMNMVKVTQRLNSGIDRVPKTYSMCYYTVSNPVRCSTICVLYSLSPDNGSRESKNLSIHFFQEITDRIDRMLYH